MKPNMPRTKPNEEPRVAARTARASAPTAAAQPRPATSQPATTTVPTGTRAPQIAHGDARIDSAAAWKELAGRLEFALPKLHTDLERRLNESSDLRALLNAPPALSSRASLDHDGRKDRLVLLVARGAGGEPLPGVLARLLKGEELRDHSRTDRRGVALLVEAASHGANAAHAHRDGEHADALVVEILRPGEDPIRRAVQIPHGRQHQVMEIVLDAIRPTEVPITMEDGAHEETHASAAAFSRPVAQMTGIDLVDNPLDRLPTDFSTELCQDIKNILGPTEDPIFGLTEGGADFRKRRIPLVKRLTIPRVGAPQPGKPPRRYLVRVRQEWTFLGYTLGELVEVEALDPGAIIDETMRSVERTVQSTTRAVDDLVNRTSESAFSGLHQTASIDSLLTIANSVRTQAVAGGFGLMLGPLALGAVGGSAGVTTNTAVRHRTDTSLDVNASLHVAKSVVNHAARLVQSARRDVQTTLSSAISQVSPLLSRVTNLLRWTLYENYMVCTHVEDIVEVQDVPIASLGSPSTPLFTDEQIVDLRRIFSPGLLEPRLRPQFDTLAAAVNARRGGALPITAVHVTAHYAPGMRGSTLTARIGTDETTIPLRRGTTRTTQTIRLSTPIDPAGLPSMELDLNLGGSVTVPLPGGSVTVPNSAVVSRLEIAYQTASGFVLRQSIPLGDTLRVDESARTATTDVPLSVPPPHVFTQHDPLFVHVNANRTYYFGLLCQAALLEPSLRDDLPHFGAFNSSHPLWRLPIVGFEGNRALVVSDADRSLQEVQDLLADPGAATLVQLAAPGAYAEALQGLLKLAVDTEALHPALLPAPAPVMPPLALVDLAGRTIPILDGSGSGATGTVGGVVGGATGGTSDGTGGGILPTLPSP